MGAGSGITAIPRLICSVVAAVALDASAHRMSVARRGEIVAREHPSRAALRSLTGQDHEQR